MIKKIVFLILFLILLGSAAAKVIAQTLQTEEKKQAIKEAFFVASVSEPKVLKIALVDCIAYTLKNNSEIRIKRIEPLISEQGILVAQAEFAPTLSLEGSVEDEKTETPSILAGSQTRITKFNFGLDGKLPLGTEYNIDLLNTRYRDNSAYLRVNPYYKSDAVITITQPLFKDFGSYVNRAGIVIAQNELEKSNQELKEELIAAISKVKAAYYNYVLYIEKYKTAQVSLQRAGDLLEIIGERQGKGLASSIDLLEADTGVAERQDSLLGIEQTLKGAEDELKYITNLIDDLELWNAHIEPLDKPEFAEVAIDLVANLKQALEYRPDYEAAKIELENQNIRILVQENALLPTIDLVGSFGLNGLDQDYEQALKADYAGWSAQVKVSWPWQNLEAKGNFQKADLVKKQLLISFERLQQQIILEVRDAVRELDIAQRKVATASKRVDTESARYAAIEQRFREGLISAHDMLEYQEDLSTAETNYIQSLIDYAQAQINLDKVAGITLAKSDVKLE